MGSTTTPDWLDPQTLRWAADVFEEEEKREDRNARHYRRTGSENSDLVKRYDAWAGCYASVVRSLRNRATRIERGHSKSPAALVALHEADDEG